MDKVKVKKDDKIILIAGNNSNSQHEGDILDVISVDASWNIKVKNSNPLKSQSIFTVYNTNPSDKWVFADRKRQAEYYKEQIESVKLTLKKLKEKVEFLEKYETEEDFVADKLHEILQVKDDKKAIAKVLKTLKSSNLL